jgi:hypothetical protein
MKNTKDPVMLDEQKYDRACERADEINQEWREQRYEWFEEQFWNGELDSDACNDFDALTVFRIARTLIDGLRCNDVELQWSRIQNEISEFDACVEGYIAAMVEASS